MRSRYSAFSFLRIAFSEQISLHVTNDENAVNVARTRGNFEEILSRVRRA